MRKLYALKDMLCEELESYADKSGKIDAPTLEAIDKLAHACKNVCKIIEDCEGEGYSNRMMPRVPNYTYDWDNMGSYARGRGPGAARDSMGRYSNEGYSRSSDFRMEFQNLLNDAPNERIRQKMMECLGEM